MPSTATEKKINKIRDSFMVIMPSVTAYWDFKHLTSIIV